MTAADPLPALAEFVANLRYEDLPADVVSHVKLCLLDTVGCGVFGATLPWTGILRDTLRDLDVGAESSVWGSTDRLSGASASLVNGAAVHGFELDDLHPRSIVHPGSVVVPAALATAEHLTATEHGRAISGREFLVAVAAGYEVAARVGSSMGAAHLLQGWHPTGTHGTFGSATACASIAGLTATATANALGLAGSQSSGLMAAQYGSMVKRFHAGRAAQSGYYAAALAARGYTGIRELLHKAYGSYVQTFSPRYDLSAVATELGERWEVCSVGFKPYSSNGSCHPTIDALLALRAEHGLGLDEVDTVEIAVSSATVDHVGWPYQPDSVTTAQMNLPYIVGVVLADGDAFVDQFSETRIRDVTLVDFARRVRVVADPEIDAKGDTHRHATRLEVRLKDGRRLRAERKHARGSSRSPLTPADVATKFHKLADRPLGFAHATRLERLVGDLDRLTDVTALASALTTSDTELSESTAPRES